MKHPSLQESLCMKSVVSWYLRALMNSTISGMFLPVQLPDFSEGYKFGIRNFPGFTMI